MAGAYLSESLKALSRLDDRLCECLARGDIRLLLSTWLRRRPPGYRIQYRQQLEELEAKGESPSPLLSPKEAVALIRKCNRGGGSVTYGWLCPGVHRRI